MTEKEIIAAFKQLPLTKMYELYNKLLTIVDNKRNREHKKDREKTLRKLYAAYLLDPDIGNLRVVYTGTYQVTTDVDLTLDEAFDMIGIEENKVDVADLHKYLRRMTNPPIDFDPNSWTEESLAIWDPPKGLCNNLGCIKTIFLPIVL